jgi:hypothetical protein
MTVLTGRFHRWTVLGFSHKDGKRSFYTCRCQCGVERPVRRDQLTRGVSKSCGCWKIEVAREQIIRLFTTHGMSNKTRTYSVWKDMRKRCLNKATNGYKNYGGRGIKVCDRWNDYTKFLSDMGEAPPGKSIDRIDNDGEYSPKNCRWADKQTQANNTRSNIFIRFNGKTLTLKQWSRELGMPYGMLWQRIYRLSWPIKKAFS